MADTVAASETRIAHDLATLAKAAGLAVAPYLRAVARTSTAVETKEDMHDPVTEHDRRVEGALHVLLGGMVPGSRVLGEETGEHVLPADPPRVSATFLEHFALPMAPEVRGAMTRCAHLGVRVRWIIDPIDGTANFAAGLPWFNTSVAAELDDEIVAGAISAPMSREIFVADAERCWYESPEKTRSLNAEGPSHEAEAVLISYHPGVGLLSAEPQLAVDHEARLARAYQTIRRPGAAALDLAMIAAGWCGAMMGISFKPWDVAAGLHLVKVAGGRVLNLPLDTDLPDGLRPAVLASAHDLDPVMARTVLEEVQNLVASRGSSALS